MSDPASSTSDLSPEVASHGHTPHTRRELMKLALGAMGVVYGDIGTSPLYAIKECVHGPHAVIVNRANVLGILSLMIWALILIVVVKYLTFVTRAHNQGEGGILALFALVTPKGSAYSSSERPRGGVLVLLMMGLFGAGLLFGESAITPAISVLSAVEGLSLATHALDPFVIPITCGILVALFMVQRMGTGGIGRVFGPVMTVWFLSIALLGIPAIVRNPDVLHAINPWHGVMFFVNNGAHGFFLLGSVVLCITGAEALYADMGHFGRKPIQAAWFTFVFPALILNYFGQGGLLLERGQAVAANPFYGLAGGWVLYPMLFVATAATVIASQALISGIFSLTRQAVQLGYFPRVRIVHTSETEHGQIYIPEINYLLMVASVALVLGFKTSSNLAAAYGIAVTGTMIITSLLLFRVARTYWNWGMPKAIALIGLFLVIDVGFFSANVNKITSGGWFPLAGAAVTFAIMTTWRRGRGELSVAFARNSMPLQLFLDDVAATKPHRVKGTAVFMTSNIDGVPGVLLHHFKHNQVLHEQLVLLSVVTERVPKVPPREQSEVKELGHGFWQVIAHYGFMQDPDIPRLLRACHRAGLKTNPATTSFYLGRETLLVSGRSKMARWRKALFAFLSRNARSATSFFGLPPNRVVELGAQIEL
jgi:KUP system potassium uptake protein